MKKIDKILVLCSDGEVSLKHIVKEMKWSTGATSVAIAGLVSRGLLQKTRYGFYSITKTGLKRLKENIKNDPERYDDIETIIQRTAALFTVDSRYGIIKALKYEKESIRSSEQTKKLQDTIRSIYIESVNSEHRGDYGMIKKMWWHHDKPKCSSCEFDFEKAYNNHSVHIKDVVGKKRLFKNLRWESFPEIERYRRNFDLPTSYTEPEIPDRWHD